MSCNINRHLFVVQIFPIIAALFGANSAPAFAFFKFMQVNYFVDDTHGAVTDSKQSYMSNISLVECKLYVLVKNEYG